MPGYKQYPLSPLLGLEVIIKANDLYRIDQPSAKAKIYLDNLGKRPAQIHEALSDDLGWRYVYFQTARLYSLLDIIDSYLSSASPQDIKNKSEKLAGLES